MPNKARMTEIEKKLNTAAHQGIKPRMPQAKEMPVQRTRMEKNQ